MVRQKRMMQIGGRVVIFFTTREKYFITTEDITTNGTEKGKVTMVNIHMVHGGD
jgi:hypothetical protein